MVEEPSCPISNDNETYELLGTTTFTAVGGQYWSLTYTILKGSVTETTDIGPITEIPVTYTGTHTARDECSYLENDIVLTGESADTRVLIRVIR